MARVRRKTRSDDGSRFATRARPARAKAMSVAVGTGQPLGDPASPWLTARYVRAGTIIPPAAANRGRASRRGLDSSPRSTSNLISRPTTRKNTAISPSLTQSATLRLWLKAPTRTGMTAWTKAK